MANDFTQIVDKIFARGLMSLRENAIMPRLVNTNFDSEVAEQGDTIDVPIPSAASVSDVTPGPTPPSGGDSSPTKAQIQLNRWRKSDMHVTDKEAREIAQGARSLQLSEHLKALANDVDAFLMGLYTDIYGYSGGAGSAPFASDLSDATAVRKVLNNQLAPMSDRRIVLSPDAEANALGIRAVQDASFRSDEENTLRTAAIGTLLGFDWFMDQNVVEHTVGSLSTTPTVNGAHTTGVSTVSLSAGGTGDINLNAGDLITFAGDTQVYAVTADADITNGSNGDVSIEPTLQVALSGGESVSLDVSSNHNVNLAFHRDAFALAVRPLAPADGFTGGNEIRTAADPVSGLSLSLEVSREHNRTKYQWSILYGAEIVRPALAARILGA